MTGATVTSLTRCDWFDRALAYPAELETHPKQSTILSAASVFLIELGD
jgi:hypothetical protein